MLTRMPQHLLIRLKSRLAILPHVPKQLDLPRPHGLTCLDLHRMRLPLPQDSALLALRPKMLPHGLPPVLMVMLPLGPQLLGATLLILPHDLKVLALYSQHEACSWRGSSCYQNPHGPIELKLRLALLRLEYELKLLTLHSLNALTSLVQCLPHGLLLLVLCPPRAPKFQALCVPHGLQLLTLRPPHEMKVHALRRSSVLKRPTPLPPDEQRHHAFVPPPELKLQERHPTHELKFLGLRRSRELQFLVQPPNARTLLLQLPRHDLEVLALRLPQDLELLAYG